MDLLPGRCGKYILAEIWEPFDLLRQVSVVAGLTCCPRGLLPVESAFSGPSSSSSLKTFSTSDHQTTDAYTIHCEKDLACLVHTFSSPSCQPTLTFCPSAKMFERGFFFSLNILQFQQIFRQVFFSFTPLQRNGFSSCAAPPSLPCFLRSPLHASRALSFVP